MNESVAPFTAPSVRCEDLAASKDFIALRGMEGIAIDLRYATQDNFAGQDLYSPLNCAWLHRDAAAALQKSVAWLAQNSPQLRLCVLDALRPQRVQQALWDALDGTTLRQYLAPPSLGSLHSFGMAIDVTLRDAASVALDMGSAFDAMTPLSHPEFEAAHQRTGALTDVQLNNRAILRAAMAGGHWQGIDSEWWHFDCGDRQVVRANYPRVL